MKNNGALMNKTPLLLILLIIAVGLIYYKMYFTPKNSLELYQALAFAESFESVQKKLMEKGYEGNITEEDFNAIKEGSMYKPSQFTVFEYYGKSFLIETTPGTERLKILSVKELPEDIRRFFSELAE
ncbi:hypothetical protein QWT69_13060 [Sporosarcina oncorhynchi]|uniref:DUF3139 domain-containing protein n=1 Tax=Sporosarcina oncorhynchi TaxID=3056444 RepID=A0ABZ0L3Q2_9BACL|nr:hypothetical protein [Sporosarcina sp. T2O-4]WOV86795.1 hypothetical protein QWT69_13060 [Sporosarcina sp. T2O-4]